MEFVRIINGKVVNHARIERIEFGAYSGRYRVMTRTAGKKYEPNINIPTFTSESKAVEYMLSLPGWRADA